jgi:DhnA family fructose-bisphosphate aldolase class Ia
MRLEGGLIVAFDHSPLGLLPGLERTETLLEEFSAHPLAGVVLNYGVLKYLGHCIPNFPITPVVRLDGNQTFMAGDWTKSADWELLYTADACQKIGARAAIVNLLLGGTSEMASIKTVASAAVACHESGIPLLVSAISLSSGDSNPGESIHYTFPARMAYELGADAVSVYGVSNPDVLEKVTRWCPVPIYAQGATTKGTERELANWAKACISAGATGVVVGRSVWQSPDPIEVVRQLLAALERLSVIWVLFESDCEIHDIERWSPEHRMDQCGATGGSPFTSLRGAGMPSGLCF